MIMTILWPFILKEWRVILGIIGIGGIYLFVYNQGFNSCEEKIQAAREKLIQEQHDDIAKRIKNLQEENAKEHNKGIELQGRLDDEIKKKQYMDCVITPNGVRLLNKLAK